MKHHTSISHFTGREQQALSRLKNKIVAGCQPLIIYLIGSKSSHHLVRNCFDHPRKEDRWHFSCELLLVLPKGASLPENAAEALKNSGSEGEHIRLLAHPFDLVAQKLQEHSLFFCWIQRRAIVLYERDHATEKLPEPVQNMKQYEQQVHRFFADHPHYENYMDLKLSPLPNGASKKKEITKDLAVTKKTSVRLPELAKTPLAVAENEKPVKE